MELSKHRLFDYPRQSGVMIVQTSWEDTNMWLPLYRKKYAISLEQIMGSDLVGVRHLSTRSIARIYRISVITRHTGVGEGAPLRVFRASGVSGGTLVSAAQIPKFDTNDPAPGLEIRTGTLSFTLAPTEPLMVLGGASVITASTAGDKSEWTAIDDYGSIILRGDEGLVFQAIAADVDTQHRVNIEWGEE